MDFASCTKFDDFLLLCIFPLNILEFRQIKTDLLITSMLLPWKEYGMKKNCFFSSHLIFTNLHVVSPFYEDLLSQKWPKNAKTRKFLLVNDAVLTSLVLLYAISFFTLIVEFFILCFSVFVLHVFLQGNLVVGLKLKLVWASQLFNWFLVFKLSSLPILCFYTENV